MKNQDPKVGDDQPVLKILTAHETLAIKGLDIVEDQDVGTTSVRYKYWKLEGGKYSVMTVGLGGPNNDTGIFWSAPDKSVDPKAYAAMLAVSFPEIIITSNGSFTVLRKVFKTSYDINELTLKGIYVEPFNPA
jgi:hypothetical protein